MLCPGSERMLHVRLCLGSRMWRLRTLVVILVMKALLLTALLMIGTQSDTTTSLTERMAPEICKPRTNIGFLKNHKCASSAIQNILFRYGEKHKLHFALPDRANYFGSGLRKFKAEMVRSLPLNNVELNIFAIHTKWDHDEVRKVMPEDTVYFTIVREPLALFQSLFVFHGLEWMKGMSMEAFVILEAVDAERRRISLGYNQMTWDFGMPQKNMNNLTAVREMVLRAEDQFGLVMVAERMEESLVLLAKYLCWELEDVLVLRLNSLRDEYKQRLSPPVRELLRKKLAPDYMVYRHFTERFERQVQAFGRKKMETEVTRLRELQAQLIKKCGFTRKKGSEINGVERPWSNKVYGFVGAGDGCSLYSLPELTFIEELRAKQMKEIEMS